MTHRIIALTPEQEASLPGFRDYGLRIGLSTEPCDRPAAEEAVRAHYQALGREPPKLLIWLDSPLQGVIGASLLSGASISGRSVGAQVRAQVRDQVWDQVRDQVWDQVRDQVRYNAAYGSHDATLASWIRAFASLGVVLPAAAATLATICETVGWWWPFERAAVLTERPNLLCRDASGRLHSTEGPALRYPDGWAIHAVGGVRVPEWVIERKHEITPGKIRAEQNAEVRRVMVKLYGLDRYVADVGAVVVDQAPADDRRKGLRTGKLYRVEDDAGRWHFIDVLNSTPEPDGSIKRYQMVVNGEHYRGEAGRSLLAAWASTYRDPREPAKLAFAKPEQALFAVET